MDEIIYTVIVAIIVALIGALIGWTKRKGYDTKFENIYIKYKMVFEIAGALIRTYDEALYNELNDALTKMKNAYESPEFTADQFNEIVKECQDVLNRVDELLNKHKGETVTEDKTSEDAVDSEGTVIEETTDTPTITEEKKE